MSAGLTTPGTCYHSPVVEQINLISGKKNCERRRRVVYEAAWTSTRGLKPDSSSPYVVFLKKTKWRLSCQFFCFKCNSALCHVRSRNWSMKKNYSLYLHVLFLKNLLGIELINFRIVFMTNCKFWVIIWFSLIVLLPRITLPNWFLQHRQSQSKRSEKL